MAEFTVKQLRVVLVTEAFDDALRYYRDTLGLAESAAYAGPDGAQVVILEAGRATLELANPAQARYIAAVETRGEPSTPVRLAFEVDDATVATGALADSGARVIAAPVGTPWQSLNARLDGPAGIQVTLFQELAVQKPGEGGDLVGTTLDALGGEAAALAATVALARIRGEQGQPPFAAIVVRDGVVIGTGVNTMLADHDPSAHGEVVAIRDAGRRIGSVNLAGAVVYSSCEPCAICRTVAAAAEVREIVFAAGRESVPREIDSDPTKTGQLMDALTALLPGIARRGSTTLTDDELTAPFDAYVAAVA